MCSNKHIQQQTDTTECSPMQTIYTCNYSPWVLIVSKVFKTQQWAYNQIFNNAHNIYP
jgi:hypothetical protein